MISLMLMFSTQGLRNVSLILGMRNTLNKTFHNTKDKTDRKQQSTGKREKVGKRDSVLIIICMALIRNSKPFLTQLCRMASSGNTAGPVENTIRQKITNEFQPVHLEVSIHPKY